MVYTQTASQEKHILKTGPNLDLESSRRLKAELLDVFEKGVKHVELDFSDTEAVSSSGLGKLLMFNEKFTEVGGSFRLVNVVHKNVVQLFQLINLESFIKIEFKNVMGGV